MRILGIDMGWSKSVSCLLDSDSGEVQYQTLRTARESFAKQIEQSRCDVVVIEAGPMAGWVKDLCEQMKMKLVVMNTNAEPWQWRNVKKKTDKQDAYKLCRLVLIGEYTTVHVPAHCVRQHRQLIFYRDTLVSEMTAIKNRIRAVLLQEDVRLSSGAKAWSGEDYSRLCSLAKEMSQCQGDELFKGLLKLELVRLEQLMMQMQDVEKKLDELAEADKRIEQLQSVPGVGARTAELVVAMIDDPDRFTR